MILPVSSTSDHRSVGSAIVRFHDEGQEVELQAVGQAASYLAVKAVIAARRWLSDRNFVVWILPSFRVVNVSGRERTALVLELRFERAR